MNQTHSKKFHCTYLLHYYPFDTQVLYILLYFKEPNWPLRPNMQICQMDLQLETFSQRNVELVPSVERVPLPNNTELTQYYIQNCTLSYQIQGVHLSCIECYVWQALSTLYSGSPSSGLKMQIVFKRRLTNELLTTYLPSLILILMCYATSFFRPIYFEAAVTVNLSILLVTTTLFIRFTQLFQSFPSIELWYSVWWQNCQRLPMFEWLIFGSYSYNFIHLLRQSHT